MEPAKSFFTRGVLHFPAEPATLAWAAQARAAAGLAVAEPANRHWLRCGGTWFVGVDALPNDATGSLPGGPPLDGAAMRFVRDELGLRLPLHRAQVSVCYPGYPRPSPEESAQAYGFRLRRDAAHVDGLLAEGPGRRRFLREPHAYVLGITLTAQAPGAAPLSVWEGSHLIMGEMFAKAFAGEPPERWGGIDVTEAYQEARREVFQRCERRLVPSLPGEAVLLHRHLLHGVAPWEEGAEAGPDGRMIAYFRPEFSDPGAWLGRS